MANSFYEVNLGTFLSAPSPEAAVESFIEWLRTENLTELFYDVVGRDGESIVIDASELPK